MSDRIANFVNKFLAWPLPQSVRPDDCVMNRDYPHRIGTNLLTATEARAMFEHCLADDPVRAALAELVAVKDIKDRGKALHFAGPSGPLGEGWEAEWKRLEREYIERQPKAWAAARAALGITDGVDAAPKPVAWLVFQPPGSEHDYKVYANEHEAEADCASQTETEAVPRPLYFGHAIGVKEVGRG